MDNTIKYIKPTKKDFDGEKYTAGCDPYILDEAGHYPTNNSVSWKDIKNKMKREE